MVAGVSGVALFIFMFLPWFGGKATASVPGAGSFSVSGGNVSAWEAFSFIDILLFLCVVVAVGLVVARAAGSVPDLPQPPGLIIAGAGGLAVLLILFRLVITPDAGVDVASVDIDVTRKIGIFLGLIAAGGITFGGWTAMNERASGAAPPEAPPATPPAAPPA
jgi:hypothetical protein